MSDERRVLVLTPAKYPAGIKGAVQIDADCGHRTWISPSGMTALLAMGVRTICLPCVPDRPIDFEELPGAREELAANIGPELANATIDAVNRATARQRHRKRHR